MTISDNSLRPASFWFRLWTLFTKEFRQIRRDKRVLVSLVIPPTLQILLFGFALNSNVTNLRLGVLDQSKTPESRELIATLTESKSFRFNGYYFDDKSLDSAISGGKLDAGVTIPTTFARDLYRGRPGNIQVILNAVDANTASIGETYAQGVLATYNQTLASQGIHSQVKTVAAADGRKGLISLMPAFFFNPGLVTSWFIVTGTLGTLLILNGSLVASTAMIKEREAGTVEQLLMTPAGTTEIVVAKIAPLFLLMTGSLFIALTLIRFVFEVPMRGNFLLVIAGAQLCMLCGIGIGTFIATYTRSSQQAQLLSFFVNPPLAVLSGALSPVEAMPSWLRPITYLNPIRHFGLITRGVMVKGSTFADLWPNLAVLVLLALLLMGFSVARFRKQLG